MRIPILEFELNRPNRGSLAWYGGIGAMTTVGLIEWPVAAIIAVGHLIAENSDSATVSGVAEGAESAAG